MKVSKLIEALKKCGSDLDVFVFTSEGDYEDFTVGEETDDDGNAIVIIDATEVISDEEE